MTPRLGLGALGVLVGVYGGWLLVTTGSWDQLVSVGAWLIGGVAVHDFVLAPAALGLGYLTLRYLPVWSRGPVAFGAVVLGAVTVAMIPVLGAWGRRDDNPTLLDRDYLTGWLVFFALVAACVTVGSLVLRSRQQGGGNDGDDSGRG